MKIQTFLFTSVFILAILPVFAFGRKPAQISQHDSIAREYYLYGEPSRYDERITAKVLYQRHQIVLKRVAGCEVPELDRIKWNANNERINRALGLPLGQDIFASVEQELIDQQKNTNFRNKTQPGNPADAATKRPQR